MLTIFYSTRKENIAFEDHLYSRASGPIEVHEFINDGTHSLTCAYNVALKECQTRYLLLVHDDVILPMGFDAKILEYFGKFPQYSILGVAGTPVMAETGIWWQHRQHMCGQVKHTKGTGKAKTSWTNRYSAAFEGELMDAAVVDGLLMAVDTKGIKCGFDESIPGFHFYDVDFCISNTLVGVKIGIMSGLEVTHKSIGEVSPQWHLNKMRFLQKHQGKLPLVVNPSIIYDADEPKLASYPKLAIVIPSNNPLLVRKVVEGLKKTKYPNYSIWVANTGSEPMEDLAKELDFNLIPYGWYNFAAINNDMVRQLPSDTELILFSNDDVYPINDAIVHMVKTHLETPNVGTVGARLHYPNGLVQHGGILFFEHSVPNSPNGVTKTLLTHRGIKTFYGVGNETREVIGNTGAFLLVSKNDFESVGGFDESMIECFEDVVLNINLILAHKKNIYQGKAVCIHAESLTRSKSPTKAQDEAKDLQERLMPMVAKNYQKLKKYIKIDKAKTN